MYALTLKAGESTGRDFMLKKLILDKFSQKEKNILFHLVRTYRMAGCDLGSY